MDQAPSGRDHDPTKKGEHLEDPMMVTMDAKARAAQEAELKALFAGARSARSEATEATPEAKDEGAKGPAVLDVEDGNSRANFLGLVRTSFYMEDKKKEVKDGEKKKGEKAEEDEDEKKEAPKSPCDP